MLQGYLLSADSCMFEREQTHSNISLNVADVFTFIRVGCSNFSPQFVTTFMTAKQEAICSSRLDQIVQRLQLSIKKVTKHYIWHSYSASKSFLQDCVFFHKLKKTHALWLQKDTKMSASGKKDYIYLFPFLKNRCDDQQINLGWPYKYLI